jgi:hypothetical protein
MPGTAAFSIGDLHGRALARVVLICVLFDRVVPVPIVHGQAKPNHTGASSERGASSSTSERGPTSPSNLSAAELQAEEAELRKLHHVEEIEHCDPWVQASSSRSCDTPRSGIVSGWYAAVDLGQMSIQDRAQQSSSLGGGFAFQARVGLAFFDYVVIGVALGAYYPHDSRPAVKRVFACSELNGQIIGCFSDRMSLKSDSVTGTFMTGEAGLQYRLRLRMWSLSAGSVAGYLYTMGGLDRTFDKCRDCAAIPVDLTARGVYVAPFLRATFGSFGVWGLIIRSQWFVTGDLQQMTYLGVEFGLP